jgi:hypothetical protein
VIAEGDEKSVSTSDVLVEGLDTNTAASTLPTAAVGVTSAAKNKKG